MPSDCRADASRNFFTRSVNFATPRSHFATPKAHFATPRGHRSTRRGQFVMPSVNPAKPRRFPTRETRRKSWVLAALRYRIELSNFLDARSGARRPNDVIVQRMKKRHHYVSQFYLGAWADPNRGGRVWEYPKAGGQPTPKRTKEIAFENHYHTTIRPDGTRDSETVENMFAELEGGAAPSIKALRECQPVTPEILEAFICYAAISFARVPQAKHNASVLTEAFLKTRAIKVAENKEGFETQFRQLKQERQEAYNSEETEEARQVLLKAKLRVKPEAALGLAIALAAPAVVSFPTMTWTFHYIDQAQHCFLTCDNPVFCCFPETAGVEFHGFEHPNVEIIFPLSPKLMALGSRRPPQGEFYTPTSKAGIDECNLRTVASAVRSIYACQESAEIVEFVSAHHRPPPVMYR